MKYAIIADVHAHLAALQAVLRDAGQRACTHTAYRHPHVPVLFVKEKDKLVRGGTYSRFKVEASKQYFVNAGSVGQPRDQRRGEVRRAAYAIYDLDGGTIELRLVDCDPPEPPPGGHGDAPVPGPPRGPRPRLSAAEELEL